MNTKSIIALLISLPLAYCNCSKSSSSSSVNSSKDGTDTGSGSGTGSVTGYPPTVSYIGSPYTFARNVTIITLTPTLSGNPATSCSAAPSLPTGLTINGTTCSISGTPTTTQASTGYTITATNSYGNGQTTISILIANAVTTLAGTNISGYADGVGSSARFSYPFGVAVDGAGNVYVADNINHTIRKITSVGVVSTFAGNGASGFVDGSGTAARFKNPFGVALDGAGNIYVTDAGNNAIRKITSAGVVTTVAGNGTQGFTDGNGSSAQFWFPFGIAVDGAGNLYVGDRDNQAIRKITSGGSVTTLAGNFTLGYTDATGSAARFNRPCGVAVDAAGNIYVADRDNYAIRKVTAAGVVTTLAGNGTFGYVDATGSAARFNQPVGIAIDASGNLYVTEYLNHAIRKIAGAAVVTTLAGNGSSGFVDAISSSAQFNNPVGVTVDGAGSIYIGDSGNQAIRKFQ